MIQKPLLWREEQCQSGSLVSDLQSVGLSHSAAVPKKADKSPKTFAFFDIAGEQTNTVQGSRWIPLQSSVRVESAMLAVVPF